MQQHVLVCFLSINSVQSVILGSLFNSRHPGHRAWGREAPSSGPERRFCGIAGVCGIRGRIPKSLFWSNPPILLAKVELSRDVFLNFLIPLSAKTPSFESISGRPSSKRTFKNRCFRLEGYDKVKQKKVHRSVTRVTFAVKTYGFCATWNS